MRKEGRLFTFVGGIFGLVGIVFFGLATFLAVNSAGFLADAERTDGVVTELVERTRTGSNGIRSRRTVYYPVVEFVAPDGTTVEFESSIGSNPPSYQVGDTVEVAYDPANASDARLTTFSNTYLLSLVFGGVGLVFTVIGMPLAVIGVRAMRRAAWLRLHGAETWTTAYEVGLIHNVRINNRHPYVIKARWLHPTTEQIHIASSRYLRNDPRLAYGTSVRVLYRPDRPEHCLVDIDAR